MPADRPASAPPALSSPLSQSDINLILKKARAFYKGRLKSSNKVYNLSKIPSPTAKHYRRNSNAAKNSDQRENQLDLSDVEGISDGAFGSWLVSKGYTAGNCPEMSSVAAHYASSLRPLRGKFTQMYMVTVNYPGDHVFLLLSVNGDKPTWQFLPNMGRDLGQNFWVIDCWFNIACPARNYFLDVWRKLDEWARQGKEILGRESDHGIVHQYDLRDDRYRDNILQGHLSYAALLR